MKLSIKDSGHRSTYSDYSKKRRSKVGRKRKPGRPKGSGKKKKRKSTKRRLPPRHKTGKRKGQFKKRKKRR